MASDKKVVVIFGATGAVGRSMLQFICKQQVLGSDIKVVAVSSDKSKCQELEKQFQIHTMTKDAKDIKQVQEVFDMHKEEGILSVVNLIGDYQYVPLTDMEEGDIMKLMQDNLVTSFNLLKIGCPILAESGGGNVACVGAAVVHYGIKHHEAWAAAKGAIEAMHRNAAATWAASNVRINCVAAGLIESPESSEISKDPMLGKASAEMYPLKRLATPDDIAWATCWLAHPKTTFCTGVALPVDGGLSCVQAEGLATAAAAKKETPSKRQRA
eukprot:GHRR01003697.1.p1 GENE.GHRR01003697.1~~GHRR01003697.1.p1  ORF type:complete len:270 (+),score=99.72 GHRR01003697.1:443-1252(+)